MAAGRIIIPNCMPALDINGNPVAGAKLTFYVNETTTLLPVYTTAALDVAHPNPVSADAAGAFPSIFADTAVLYSVAITDADDAPITGLRNRDDVQASVSIFETAAAAVSSFMQPLLLSASNSAFLAALGQIASTAVNFLQAGIGAVTRTAQDKMRDVVSAKDFGVVGDGTTNNATAFGLIKTAVEAGVTVHFPYGIYASSVPLNFTAPGYMTADPGTRIKLTASANYVIQFDFTAGGPFFDHLHGLANFVLDGNGFAVDGLSLKGAISGYFDNIRVTNVTRAGFHLGWAQQCFFLACHCSKNVEPFTTTPVNAWLIDTAASSANTFEHCQISGASGDGVRAISLFNSTFISCTSEGNGGAGYRFGVAGSGLQCLSNTVLGGDVEVNTGGDFVIDNTAIDTNIIGAKAGFGTTLSVRVMSGAAQTLFLSGCIGAAQVDSGAIQTRFDNVSFIGVGAGLTDAGSGTSWRGLRNFSDGVVTPDSTFAGYILTDAAAASTYNTNAKLDRVHMINATGTTMTVANPTNAVSGQKITYVIGNYSFGTLAVTWGSAFRAETWISPPHGEVRSISFSYDANFGKWNPIAITALSPLAAVADLTVTATSGSLPTANGSVTIANAATPTVVELLEFCVELEAKVEALAARLRSAGVIVP